MAVMVRLALILALAWPAMSMRAEESPLAAFFGEDVRRSISDSDTGLTERDLGASIQSQEAGFRPT